MRALSVLLLFGVLACSRATSTHPRRQQPSPSRHRRQDTRERRCAVGSQALEGLKPTTSDHGQRSVIRGVHRPPHR